MKDGNLRKKSVRLKESQICYLQKRADEADRTMSWYLRELIDDDMERGVVRTREQSKKLRRELINEINHIGVNINQIVKNHNAQFYSSAEKKKLFLLMQNLNDMVNEYLKG